MDEELKPAGGSRLPLSERALRMSVVLTKGFYRGMTGVLISLVCLRLFRVLELNRILKD